LDFGSVIRSRAWVIQVRRPIKLPAGFSANRLSVGQDWQPRASVICRAGRDRRRNSGELALKDETSCEGRRGNEGKNSMNDVTQEALVSPATSLSILSLFLQADIVVKCVMIGLSAALAWCIAITVNKIWLFGKTKRQMDAFEQVFWSGQSLEELYRNLAQRNNSGMPALFVAAMREWKRSHEGGRAAIGSLQQRIDKVMDVTIGRELERLQSKLLVLATIGSSAPFIGLFGTVYGIMTAFIGIAASKNTSLAVVAPGIAEALFATAMGLVAAIPAVIAYNTLTSDANALSGRLETFADEFSAILSRQIDERQAA
jgi:biopolymer transport protein TolQ